MEHKHITLNAVCMASGFSKRFGAQNKLLAFFGNGLLVEKALSLLEFPLFHKTVIVTGEAEIITLANEMGISAIENKHPEQGQSHSIQLGLQALPPADGTLFLPADMPLLSAHMLRRMYNLFAKNIDSIIAASANGVRKSPVIFPATCNEDLLALQADHGGKHIIEHGHYPMLLCEAPNPTELLDVDTPQDLAKLFEIAKTL